MSQNEHGIEHVPYSATKAILSALHELLHV